ncbi:MAG: hypothetical protein JNK82_37195 [Myxococcaceae bacterium]|nr:hypothetical protein [Myxococcaceae bacterium]
MLTTAAVWKLVLCAAQLKLATVGFSQVGLSDAQASFYAEHFSVQLQRVDEQGVRVTTPKDMAAALGIEKQKQLLGCADESSSCMAELAGALGADGFVTGQIARVGQSFQLNVKILAPDGTQALFLYSSKLLHTEEELIEELNAVALLAIAKLRGGKTSSAGVVAPPVEAVSAPASERAPRSKLKLLPIAGGAIALGLGTVGLIQSAQQYSKLSDPARWPNLDIREANNAHQSGKTALAAGLTLAIAGVVVIVASVLWYLLT